MEQVDLSVSALLAVTLVAAVIDWRTHHIPNRLMALGLAVGMTTHIASDLSTGAAFQTPLATLGGSFTSIALGILFCSLVPVMLFLRGAMGGADVKLLAVVGATLGPVAGLQVTWWSFLLAALYALLRWAYLGDLYRLIANSAYTLAKPFRKGNKERDNSAGPMTWLPFGPAVFAALLLVTGAQTWVQ